jgi:hypothetical protein
MRPPLGRAFKKKLLIIFANASSTFIKDKSYSGKAKLSTGGCARKAERLAKSEVINALLCKVLA